MDISDLPIREWHRSLTNPIRISNSNVGDESVSDGIWPRRSIQLISGTASELSQSHAIETVIDCNCLYLARAYSNNTYNYRFSVTPGIHAEDLLYTFYPTTLTGYNLPLSVPDVDAKAFQSYFTSFAIHGDPNTARMSGSVPFPLFGSSENIVDVSLAGFAETTDDELPEDRCAFWQPAPYM